VGQIPIDMNAILLVLLEYEGQFPTRKNSTRRNDQDGDTASWADVPVRMRGTPVGE
jgi:hypothetical protein